MQHHSHLMHLASARGLKKAGITSFECISTLNSFFTISGDEIQGCKQKGCFIFTEFGGNLASKSVNHNNYCLATVKYGKHVHILYATELLEFLFPI